MKTIPAGEVPKIPSHFVCPICGAALVFHEITAWEQEDDGSWIATEIGFDCTTDPGIDSDEWEDWQSGHYSMPYVDWLPLEQQILAWLKDNYRFSGLDTPQPLQLPRVHPGIQVPSYSTPG